MNTVSLSQAAREIGISYHWALRQVNDGKLPAEKVDGDWRVSMDAITEYKQKKTERERKATNAIA